MPLKGQISVASIRNIRRKIWKPRGYQETILHLVEMKAIQTKQTLEFMLDSRQTFANLINTVC